MKKYRFNGFGGHVEKKQKEKGIIDSTMLSGFSQTNKMMTKNLFLHLTIQKSSPTSTAQFGGKSNGVRL